MGKSKVAKRYTISGRVQGVGFRFFVQRWANQLGISGYVRNTWEGTVDVYAIGNEAALGELKRHLSEGPRSARVAHVDEANEAVSDHYSMFVIEG